MVRLGDLMHLGVSKGLVKEGSGDKKGMWGGGYCISGGIGL